MKTLFATLVMSFAAAAFAAGPLVDGAWLEKQLKSPDLVLIDASPAKAYAAGHIPGAINVDLFSFGADEAAPAEMERRIRSWGIGAGKRVVLYDQGGTYSATSIHYDLAYHGVPAEALHLLDGGLAKWKAEGRAVTQEPAPKPAEGDFRLGALRRETRVDLPAFLVASGEPARHALVEALEPAMHFGGAKFFDRAGHIPNALMAPPGDFFNADKTFKSPAEIRRMLAYLGATPDKTLHAHCGGGIAASVPYFAAKHLAGYPQVVLFKGSQLAWLRDERNLPFWTYDAPNAVRDKAWVNGWNNPMVRMYGVSRMALVDVRPLEAWKQLRIPHATNVPAEALRRDFRDPAKVAEALAAAGVNPRDEAVIVGAGGLTPDVALAYLALESSGQARVSLLMESVEDWGLAGLPTESTAPQVKAVPARATPRSARRTDHGYAKVFLATGATVPGSVANDAKVVHLPFTQLLDAQRRPRPAHELWALLAKAGVPRYAEVVAVADDPGEAAVGYVVLKMMGWPDVRVQSP